MDSHTKETFFNSRLLRFSLSTEDEDDKTLERKKLKQLAGEPLSDEEFKSGLGNIGKTAHGDGYAFLSLRLVSSGIYTILGIEKFIHLQQVDVSNNNLSTLKPLSRLKYLTHIYAANNKLTKMADFHASHALEVLDLSDNEISEMVDMHEHRFLKRLNLNNNNIFHIKGIERNKNLEILHLNFNKITDIENLEDLNLTELHLFGNNIKHIRGLSKLPLLRHLDLSRNKIRKMRGLIELSALRKLCLADNDVSKLSHLIPLENLSFLSDLDLCFNPIQKRRHYRYQAIYKLPQLRSLDGVSINSEEAVKAENFFGLDVDERKQIFNGVLAEEEFVDRRIFRSDFLDPESASENEDVDLMDEYDREGKLLRKTNSPKSVLSNKSRMLGVTKSSQKRESMPGSPTSMLSVGVSRSMNRNMIIMGNDDVIHEN